MRAQIGIMHVSTVPSGFLDEFVQEMRNEDIEVDIHSHQGIFAGLELYLPTAILVYLTKPYFEAFLSELGKDHYRVLKGAITRLFARTVKLRYTAVGSAGKLSPERKYSLAFSVTANLAGNIQYKFLLQEHLTAAEGEVAITAFLDLARAMVEKRVPSEVAVELNRARLVGRTVLLCYDFSGGRIIAVDPLTPSAPRGE